MVEAGERSASSRFNRGNFRPQVGASVRSTKNFCPPELVKPHHSVFVFVEGVEVGTCRDCGHKQEISSNVAGDRSARTTYDGTINDDGGLRFSLDQIVKRARPISSSYD